MMTRETSTVVWGMFLGGLWALLGAGSLAPTWADEAVAPGKEVLQINDRLTEDLPRDRERQDCFHKVHTLRMKPGRAYLVDMKSADFDSYLRLENAQGQKLAENDDGGDGLNARLLFRPKQEGTYRLIATTCGDGEKGNYSLTVQETIEKEVLNVKNQLTNDLPKDKVRQGSFHKVYFVKMTKGSSYSLEMNSEAFDSYLRLETAAGRPLAEDDDGGGNLNSRLFFQAPTSDTYRVIVTTLEPGATGEFQVMVHEMQKAKKE